MECVTCKTKNGEPVLLCDSCQRSTHRECSGLSASELKVMDLKGRRFLKFYCEDCQNGIKLIPKLLIKIDKLEEEIKQLKRVGEESKALTLSEEDLIGEMMERQSRASNIIIYNVNESKKKSQQERNNEDINTVQEILENFDFDKGKIKSFRLGKFLPSKIRPIKAILPSPENVKQILKNRELIKGPSVRIYLDQTIMQREYFKKIKNELQALIDSGDANKTIKFINNKPTIVNKVISGNSKNLL